MGLSSILRCSFIVAGIALVVPAISAQNAIQLFGPVNVRASTRGTGYGANSATFNSTTLNLNCSASPVTAVLSSSANSSGNVLVDNFINVTATSGTTITGPVNVCRGGTSDDTPDGR